MKDEDDGHTKTFENVSTKEAAQTCARPPLHSWSCHRCSNQIHFRSPLYRSSECPAPQLKQKQFSGELTPDVEKQELEDLQVPTCSLSPKCLPKLSTAMYDSEYITPGILRPEERHNNIGRCRHHDHRKHHILDTALIDTSRNIQDENEEPDPLSAATLVASETSKSPFDKHNGFYGAHRGSTSSASSYSSQASEVENPVTANQLIRYYTSLGSDNDEEVLANRVSRFSTATNPWQLEEALQETSHPLQSNPIDRQRQRSAPPPYALGNRKPSDISREYFKTRARGPQKRQSSIRRARRSNDILEKHAFILKLCKAFLLFGIQAHRLEEYMHNTAVYLGITAEFQYVPHCIFIVLTDLYCDRNEVHLLKESTSVDLNKLEDIYLVYESVVTRDVHLQLAIKELDTIIRRRKVYNNILLILLHGVSATCAGTFAFAARPIDFPALFIFGCLLAILQLIVLRTPIRNSHILEVLTCIVVAFSGRALGSIRPNGGPPIFCFSGIVQGTIALILPGHIILAATHEVQNRQVLSGAVKMIYAILYTLFLGFGTLIGSALFGFLHADAINATTCQMPWYWDTLTERWRATYAQFVWVPVFALAISIMHQAKRKHLPAMVFIATCGHQAFYWSLSRFAQNLQFAGLIAAFASGLLANLYALLSKCLAATILLPAVLVHIPNALASSGSLVAGVDTADAIVTNSTYWIDGTLITRDFSAKGPSGSTGRIITAGFGMAQATIGITVGLFLSAFVVYPFTRRKRAGALAF